MTFHLERETRLELATYSLEGYRSTKWATPANTFKRTPASAKASANEVGKDGFEPPNS